MGEDILAALDIVDFPADTARWILDVLISTNSLLSRELTISGTSAAMRENFLGCPDVK